MNIGKKINAFASLRFKTGNIYLVAEKPAHTINGIPIVILAIGELILVIPMMVMYMASGIVQYDKAVNKDYPTDSGVLTVMNLNKKYSSVNPDIPIM